MSWATTMDYDIAGVELTDEGVLKPSVGGRKGKRDERRADKGERKSERKDSEKEDAAAKQDAMETVQTSEGVVKK